MKKFDICFILLLIFAGFVFFTGWTQFKVKADTCAVLISKTSGVYDKPLENGKFSWHWQFLLPTNATLKKFSIKPLNTTKQIKGELPSGAVYTSIFNSNDNFSYSFDFTIGVTISPEAVVSLYKENKIYENDDLQNYLQGAVDTIAQLATDFYLNKAKENPDYILESLRRDDVLRAIQIYKEYPDVELMTFAMTSSKIPDYKLYTKLQNQFMTNTISNSVQAETEEADNE